MKREEGDREGVVEIDGVEGIERERIDQNDGEKREIEGGT